MSCNSCGGTSSRPTNWYVLDPKYRNLPDCQLQNPITQPPLLAPNGRAARLFGEPHGMIGTRNADGTYSFKHAYELHHVTTDLDGDGQEDFMNLLSDQTYRNGQKHGIKLSASMAEGPLLRNPITGEMEKTSYMDEIALDMPGEQITFKADGPNIPGTNAKQAEAYIGGQKIELAPGEKKVLRTEKVPDPRHPSRTIDVEYAIERLPNGELRFISPEYTGKIQTEHWQGHDILNVEAAENVFTDGNKQFKLSNDQKASGIFGDTMFNDEIANKLSTEGAPGKKFSDFFGDLMNYINYSSGQRPTNR